MREAANSMVVADVATYSYGTFAISLDPVSGQEVLKNIIIIPRNTKIPAKISKSFFLRHDGQSAVDATVTQGESEDKDEVNIICEGNMDLSGITTFEGDEVIVEYSYDINQMMHCTFTHKKSKKQFVLDFSEKITNIYGFFKGFIQKRI